MTAEAAGISRAGLVVPDIRVVVEEFGRLLEILGDQLGAAVTESHSEYRAVGEAFQQLVTAKNRIDAIVYQEPEHSVVRRNCATIGESLDSAVVALQFHDRLTQRVGHIRSSLDHLQSILRDGVARSFDDWLRLLRDVEHAQVLQQQRLALADGQDESNDNVELF